MRRWFASVLVLLLARGPRALAQDAPPPGPAAAPAARADEAVAADEVLAALAAKDDATLRRLASGDDPDPWSVAEQLLVEGRAEAARAFAAASPRPDVEALPAYVAARAPRPDDAARRARLDAANAARGGERPDDAWRHLEAPEPRPLADVLAVRLAMGRALALGLRERHDAALDELRDVAAAAESMGWLARAAGALDHAGALSLAVGRTGDAAALRDRLAALCDRRGDAGAAGRARFVAGQILLATGDPEAALGRFRRAAADLASAGDAPMSAVATSRAGLAQIFLDDTAGAIETLGAALAAQTALGDRAGAVATRGDLARARRVRGEWAEAIALWTTVREEQLALGDRLAAARTLADLGTAHRDRGAYEEAERAVRAAIVELAGVAGADDVATAHAMLGSVLLLRGRYPEALVALTEALRTHEASHDPLPAAATLSTMGLVHAALGELDASVAHYERALAVQRKAGARGDAATTQGNLANVLASRGDGARALTLLDQALATHEASGNRAAAAAVRLSASSILSSLGDRVRARTMLERARADLEAVGDRDGVAVAWCNLGARAHADGDFDRARTCFEKSLAGFEAAGTRASVPNVRMNLGIVARDLDGAAASLPLLERARAEASELRDARTEAVATRELGVSYAALGDGARAVAALEAALAAFESRGERPEEANVLGLLSKEHLRAGRTADALATARRAVGRAAETARGLGADEGATARRPLAFVYDVGAQAALAAGDVDAYAFFLESGRAGALVEGLASRDALWGAAVPAELRAAEGRARAEETAARRALDEATDLATARERRAALAEARDRVSAVVARIQREAKAGADLVVGAAATLGEVRASLAADEVLVAYDLPADDARALVVTRDAARVVALGPTSAIARAAEAFVPSDPAADVTDAADALAALVTAPLSLPKTARRVLVSPTGALALVPFAALLRDVTVAYVPSGTVHVRLSEDRVPRGDGVLALGDPAYPATDARGGARASRLVRLPATREEAKALGTRVLLGDEATEAGLRAAVATRPRWRAVHLACHGLVDPERPAFSALALTPSGDDDGFLGALEVSRMRVPADLVVLSACETGKAKVVEGEGLVGFVRVFMFAGAPRVLCSLWKVDDEATAALMTKFYELWSPKTGSTGMGTADALRAAQEHLRSQEKWKHPYYWAAWVLWGVGG